LKTESRSFAIASNMSVPSVKSQQIATVKNAIDGGSGMPGASSLTIDKILKLFTSKHTAELYDRQSSAVARLCRHTAQAGGFSISDLAKVCSVIDICGDHLKNGQETFRDCLCSVVDLLGTEFRRTRANEEFTNGSAISSVVRKLGDLLFFPDPAVQIIASKSLLSISKGCLDGERNDKSRGNNPDDMRPTNREYYQGMIRSEGVLEMAINALVLEVQELLRYDVNNDGVIDMAEMEQFKADNDDIQGNEDVSVRNAQKNAAEANRPKSSGEEQRNQDEASDQAEKPPPYFLLSLIHFICQCSYDDNNASVIIQSEALKVLVDVLATVVDFREEVLAIIMEVLWNLLEKSEDAIDSMKSASHIPQKREELLHAFRTTNAIFVLGRTETFTTLQSLLLRVFEGGFKRKDKELRNETLICLHILADREKNLPFFVKTRILDLLLAYSTGMEAPQIDGCEKVWKLKYAGEFKAPIRNYATTSHEDLECKLLMLDLISKVCARDTSCLDIVAQSPLFFPVLFAYLEGSGTTNLAGLTPWQMPQVEMIQRQIFTVLQDLCPKIPKFYSQMKGNEKVLAYLNDPRNSWELRGMALELLCAVSTMDGQAEDVGELGCVEMMVKLFHSDGIMESKIMVNACVLLSNICYGDGQEDNKNQVRLRKNGGVEILRERIRWSPEDSLSAQDKAIAIIGAVWGCVVGNRRSEARFLKLEGVDALLDMVEVCPRIMQPQIVGTIADLMRNPKAIPYFKSWKSDINMKSASQLFLEMWIAEEARLGLARPQATGGIIANLIYPLRKHYDASATRSEMEEREKVNEPESPIAHARLKEALAAAKTFEAGKAVDKETELLAAVVNSSDLRPKVYAALAAVGFENIEEDLETEETKISKVYSEQYPIFRVGEIYADIKEELAIENVTPVSADSLWIEGQLEEAFNIASGVKCEQTAVKFRADGNMQEGEANFLNSIRQKGEQELQAQLSMKKNRMPKNSMKARLEAKAKKAEMLKKSLQH
jgi:hypothetical protein